MAASATAISDSVRASSAVLEAWLESKFMLVTVWVYLFVWRPENAGAALLKNFKLERPNRCADFA